MKQEKIAKVALVDDHTLLRNGLAALISGFDGYEVILEAANGQDFISKCAGIETLHIALVDINMPVMDGFATAQWIRNHLPDTRVMALSMYDQENTVIRMFRSGAVGYILKDAQPQELKKALDSVMERGYYHSDLIASKLMHSVQQLDDEKSDMSRLVHLTEREIAFLKLAATELTYKEIADRFNVSPRTVDGYRDELFAKLGISSRVGLVLYAVRSGIVIL